MATAKFPPLAEGKPELVLVGKNHYTLNKHHPLFLSLVDRTTFYTIPSTSVKVPRLYDVSSITENPELFQSVIDWLSARYRAMGNQGPTHILAIETGGCFVGAPLAVELGIPFVPIRREELNENSFVTEGEEQKPPSPPMGVRHNSITKQSRVVVIDDFISSGRTMDGALDCIEIVGSTVIEAVVICDMQEGDGITFVQSERPKKNVRIISLFRLRNTLEVLFVPKRYRQSRL